MDSLPIVAATTLAKAAAGLIILAWFLWSFKRIHTAIVNVYENWERWDTYPIPDKRATWNIAVTLGIVAGWLILSAAIILYVSWVAGIVP